MNKKLIALAVAGVTLAPAVMAQTANPVTLYGRIYATLNTVNANGSGVPGGVDTQPISRRGVVQDGNSHIGVRGTEDLGGGLKAFFQVESAVLLNTGGGTFASRNSAVGLQGGFGSILIGRWDTPFKTAALLNDPTGQLTLADPTALLGTAAIGGLNPFNRRQDNSVQYWTPNINGFTGRFLYSPNQGKTATANPTTLGLNAQYAGGPVTLAYAYEVHKDQVNNTITAGAKEKGHELVGTVKFGPFKVGATYQRFDRNGTTNQKVGLVTGQYDVGNHSIFGLYGKSKDGLADGAVQPIGKMASVGYYYNFSKRTSFVAVYTSIVNNYAAKFSFNGTGTATIVSGPGSDPKGFGVGLRHFF